jgi:hypothetical protein
MLQGQATRQTRTVGANPSTKPPSPQAAYAQEHGAELKTCKVLVGRAKLGGQPGILITSIDTNRNKAWLFCQGATGTNCVLRTAKPREEATAWAKGSKTKKTDCPRPVRLHHQKEESQWLSHHHSWPRHHVLSAHGLMRQQAAVPDQKRVIQRSIVAATSSRVAQVAAAVS